MPIDPEIKAEIEAARKIIQEDLHAKGLRDLNERFDKQFPPSTERGGADTETEEDGNPKPPEKIDNPNEGPQPPKSKWWGDQLD